MLATLGLLYWDCVGLAHIALLTEKQVEHEMEPGSMLVILRPL